MIVAWQADRPTPPKKTPKNKRKAKHKGTASEENAWRYKIKEWTAGRKIGVGGGGVWGIEGGQSRNLSPCVHALWLS